MQLIKTFFLVILSTDVLPRFLLKLDPFIQTVPEFGGRNRKDSRLIGIKIKVNKIQT